MTITRRTDADLITVEEEKHARSAFTSSRTRKGEREKNSPTFAVRTRKKKRKQAASTSTSTASMSSRRTERTRYCDWEPARCPCISRSAIHDGSTLLPSRPSPSVRSRETVFPGDRDRVRPPFASTPHSRDACSRTGLELLACDTRNRCTRHTCCRDDPLGWRKGVTIRSI